MFDLTLKLLYLDGQGWNVTQVQMGDIRVLLHEPCFRDLNSRYTQAIGTTKIFRKMKMFEIFDFSIFHCCWRRNDGSECFSVSVFLIFEKLTKLRDTQHFVSEKRFRFSLLVVQLPVRLSCSVALFQSYFNRMLLIPNPDKVLLYFCSNSELTHPRVKIW